MICGNCGTENLAGARFCMECATPFGQRCPNCGTENLAQAKFCSQCATPLAASARPAVTQSVPVPAAQPTVAERRLVSVLFADLVGFTTFSEGRDAEEVRDLQNRYFRTVSEIIERYGGTVEKFIGDAVMALWGAPIAHEDDAERAVRAALDLVDTVRGLGPGIEARAGVLTDEAAVTVGATNQGMVSGDMVNTASRLQGVAPPSTVLVGEATVRAAASAIVFEQVGEQTLKGKVSPVPAWQAIRVVARRRGVGRSEALEAPFVGRDEELRQLRELFHATSREGRVRLVSVVGPGGIGKSRLAWEFLKYVDGLVENAWWHDGRCPAYGDGITFWALGEMIRVRARLQESDDEQTTRAGIRQMLEQHVPDAAEREWIEPAMLSLLGIESTMVASEQLFGAWRTFFERLAASGPVIMVFEDLQHADAGQLDFIDHLLEWSRTSPILIITLARPELMDRRPDWGAGKRNFSSIYLDPLPVEKMRELLDGLVPGLPTAARDAIIGRADGVPLYAVETVRMLLAQGKLVVEDGVHQVAGDLTDLAVPETLTALISSRLDELEPADRSLIADAAVLGQSLSLAALAAVSGIDPPSLEPRVRRLVRHELLQQQVDPRSPERGQWTFVQALIREVAYNTLARPDRKVRHLAAARYFESLGSDELAGALAGHYLAAHGYADGPEADALAAQARVALRAAADRAAALGSNVQALALVDKALKVSPGAVDRAEFHERAHQAAFRAFLPQEAEHHAQAVIDARRELGDREQIVQAIADWASSCLFLSVAEDRLMPTLLGAWDEFSDLEQTPAGVSLMLQLARAYGGPVNDDVQRLAWLERMMPIAERLGLVHDVARGLAAMNTGLFRLGRPRQAAILLRGAHELAVANDFEDVHRHTRTTLTFRAQLDDPQEGLALTREGLDFAARIGSLTYGFVMVGNGVTCALRVGEWEWATKLLEEWFAAEVPIGYQLELYVDRALFTALTGGDPQPDIHAAEQELPATTDTQYLSYVHWAKATSALVVGKLADSRSYALAAGDATNYFYGLTLPLAARAMLWASDPIALAEVVARFDATAHAGEAVELDGVTMHAGLAALDGRRSEAIAAYREALRGWKRIGCAFDEALAVIDMATVLKPSEMEMPEAPSVIEAARETLSRLGAKPMLERLEAAIATGTPAETARPVGTSESVPITA